jgi:serine/threonine protein kinase
MGTIIGTPSFMPPEQAGGRIDDIDTRSDIYALGVVLYFILTAGELPFDAPSTAELLELID